MDASDSDSSVDLVFDSQPDAAPDDEEERRGVETVTVGAPNGDDDVERGNGRSSIGRRRSGRAARLGSFLPEPSLAESGNDALYMSEHQGNDDDDGSIDDDGANFGSLRSIPAVTSSGAAGAGPSQIPRRPSVHDVAAMDALKRSLTLASSGSLHSSMNRTNSFAYNSAALSRTNSMISLASRGTSASVSRRKSPPDLDEESQLRGGSGAEVEVDDVDPHTRAFRAAIRSACHDAFGVMGVDVWLHDEADGSFHHAPGGYYRHRGYRPEDAAQKFALERLEDETRADFVPPARQVPGAGLAGFFWSQCSTHDRANTWRDVRAIVDDPDQPPYPRMRVLCEAGYGKATGVPFDVRGHRGVVLYFARATADRGQLTEFVNDVHLRASADLIGAISASSIAAEASKAAKADRLAKTMRRVRAKMVCILVFAKWFKDPDDRENFMENAAVRNDAAGTKPAKLSMSRRLSMEVRRKMRKSYRQSVFNAMVECAKHKVRLTVEKSKGGHMQPPPCMPWVQAVWVFVGALLTLMVLSAMSLALVDSTGYGLVMGPFGALMTLQYGLTPAPASQPRNAIYGQTVALSIALLINLASPSGWWLRVPLATSLAVAAMCKLGIVHPPAGAAAAIFSSSAEHDGISFALMLLGNVVAIGTAVLINNLNDKKQYPVYYAFVGEEATTRKVDGLEGIAPYFKRKKLEREEELRNELDLSLHRTLAEFNKQKNAK